MNDLSSSQHAKAPSSGTKSGTQSDTKSENSQDEKRICTPSQQQAIQAVIEGLGLEPHVEGGYFKETFRNEQSFQFGDRNRSVLTSIYYLLTIDSPHGRFHLNQSDIVHYFQLGDPITYYLIHPSGELETRILGNDLSQGHELQFNVPAGVWKASQMNANGEHGFGLLGEAVAPGFDYEDMTIGLADDLIAQFPQHGDLIGKLGKRHS